MTNPWSINTRKVLAVLAEKGEQADLSLVRLPQGEQRLPAHVALHPFAKVPVLDDAGFFSLADVHVMPYIEYLEKTGQSAPVERRANLRAWWQRVSRRPAWQKVARTGPQPYEAGMTAEVIEQRFRAMR